ncbi:hypothetical protein [Acuticoccus sp.]|uniref:hypothetical protein n=1 Tax=Acuticoccus sp. TaxID=1904378 RepID=UPI003B51EE95
MATLVTVLRSGGRYDARWVERLAGGARRHVPGLARVVCLTDLALDVEGCEAVPLTHGWPAWWSKFEAFRPGVFDGTVALVDLDTVFAGDAAALVASPSLCVMEDYFHKGRVSSALMRFAADTLVELYDAFAADPVRWMAPGSCGPVPNAVHGDQVVMDHLLRTAGRPPAFFQHEHPGLIDFYAPHKTGYGPVIVFIGDAKPDRAGEPIASLWRGPADPPVRG